MIAHRDDFGEIAVPPCLQWYRLCIITSSVIC